MIGNKYRSVEINDEQIYKINEVRDNFEKINYLLTELLPESREKSLALTNLEQSSMWAIKSITHGE